MASKIGLSGKAANAAFVDSMAEDKLIVVDQNATRMQCPGQLHHFVAYLQSTLRFIWTSSSKSGRVDLQPKPLWALPPGDEARFRQTVTGHDVFLRGEQVLQIWTRGDIIRRY